MISERTKSSISAQVIFVFFVEFRKGLCIQILFASHDVEHLEELFLGKIGPGVVKLGQIELFNKGAKNFILELRGERLQIEVNGVKSKRRQHRIGIPVLIRLCHRRVIDRKDLDDFEASIACPVNQRDQIEEFTTSQTPLCPKRKDRNVDTSAPLRGCMGIHSSDHKPPFFPMISSSSSTNST